VLILWKKITISTGCEKFETKKRLQKPFSKALRLTTPKQAKKYCLKLIHMPVLLNSHQRFQSSRKLPLLKIFAIKSQLVTGLFHYLTKLALYLPIHA